MRVVTACTGCHRIGAGKGGRSGAAGLVGGVGRPAVPGPEGGELLGLEDIAPAAPVAGADLLTDDPERVQEASEAAGSGGARLSGGSAWAA